MPAAATSSARFAVVYHLLSLANNWRLRVRTFASEDDFPVVDSVIDVWPAANWYEREAFDLYGIMFTGHPDLRRIPIVVLTTSKAEEDIYRTYDLGANSFITKPVSFDGLVNVMRDLGRYWIEIVELPPDRLV